MSEENENVTGRAIILPDGRSIALYLLKSDSFGWEFKNEKGDVTRIALSREAMNAVIQLHHDATWDRFFPEDWRVAREPDAVETPDTSVTDSGVQP